VPRCRHYVRSLRAQPPAAPRVLARMPGHGSRTSSAEPDEVLLAAAQVLPGPSAACSARPGRRSSWKAPASPTPAPRTTTSPLARLPPVTASNRSGSGSRTSPPPTSAPDRGAAPSAPSSRV
jgi:hypothetical protein